MKLFQIFLPVYNQNGEPFPRSYFNEAGGFLTEKFGGVTAFSRSPATGFWKDDSGEVVKDDIVIFEVMTDQNDLPFWNGYRKQLEDKFAQEMILIRVSDIEVL